MRVVVAVTAAALVVVGVAAASPQQSTAQHVTVIGDSVAEGMSGDADAVAILSQGIDLDLETAPCRRVDGDSCPYEGVRVPTLVELAKTLGPKLGPNVVVAVGYNDFESAVRAEHPNRAHDAQGPGREAHLVADPARCAPSPREHERRHRGRGGVAS